MSVKSILFIWVFILFCGLNNNCVFGVNDSFERSSILYGIARIADDQVRNNGSTNFCYKQLVEFYDAVELKKVWAYKMMDVSGRPSTGFLGGSNGWTGQSTTCDDLTNRSPPEVYRAKVVQLFTDHDYPPYDVGFMSSFMRHNSPVQMRTNTQNQNLINLGLCTPLTCTGDDIQPLLENLFKKKLLTFQRLYDVNFEIEVMKTVDATSAWLTANPLNMFTLSLFFGIIIFVSSASYYHLNIFAENIEIFKLNNDTNDQSSAREKFESEKVKEKDELKIQENLDPLQEINKATNIFDKIILCFSWSNTHKLLLKSDVPENVGAINGMMLFAMLGISIYHFLIYGALYTKSLAMDFRKYEGFLWQIVVNSSYSIDTYLFLSGCLVSYNLYSTKRGILLKAGYFTRVYEMFKIIAEKVIKSLPVYTMWLLWSIYLFSYLDARWSTPLPEKPHDACPRTWWRNLLFINNLQPLHSSDTCMSWTWLIAADMQYFVLNVLLMMVSIFSSKISIGLTVSMIFYCIYSTGFAAYKIGYIHTLDQQIGQIEPIYHLPWHRVGPYAIGMLTGLLLYKLNGNLPLRKKFIWLGWSLAPLINFYLIFGLYGIKPTVEFSSIYIALGRTAWAVGLSWILIACSTGNAGFINTILSYGGFKIFHRLSYSTYILMVLNIIFICVTYETTIYLSTISYISQIFSFALSPYFFNVILTMFYEIPFELLWKTFIN